MRVIAGHAKKCRLLTPPGLAVRPTADRVKEALFNILGTSVGGARFLDLFAGAGGVGIEALSRGANQVVFVEKERNNLEIVKKNLLLTGLAAKARCLGMPANKALALLGAEKQAFELVFMDPPYGQNLAPGILSCLVAYGLLSFRAVVVVESGKKALPPENLGEKLGIFRQEKYGATVLSFYQLK